jgi:signal transduction histidine kinase
VANAVRHSGAGTVRVVLQRDSGALEVAVCDDGTGLVDGARHGVGLASMRTRSEELGGTFSLVSDEGGTTLRARLPLDPAGETRREEVTP